MAVCLRGYLGSEAMAGSSLLTKQKRLEVVKILVENGADVNIRGKIIGMTPLHWASYNDDPQVVKYLLEDCKAEL